MKKRKHATPKPKNRAQTLINLKHTHRQLDEQITLAEEAYQATPTPGRRDEIRAMKKRKCTLRTRIMRFEAQCQASAVDADTAPAVLDHTAAPQLLAPPPAEILLDVSPVEPVVMFATRRQKVA